jgi:hypothetical protein
MDIFTVVVLYKEKRLLTSKTAEDLGIPCSSVQNCA